MENINYIVICDGLYTTTEYDGSDFNKALATFHESKSIHHQTFLYYGDKLLLRA